MINKTITSTHELPIVAIRGIVCLPNNDVRLEVGRVMSVEAIKQAEKYDNHVILINQKDVLKEEPSLKDLNRYGIVAKIILKIKLPNGNYKVKFKCLIRSEIIEFTNTEKFLMGKVQTLPAVVESNPELLAMLRMLINDVVENADSLFTHSTEVIAKIQGTNTPDNICDIIATNLKISESDKLKYVETVEVNKRLKFLLEDVEREKLIVTLEDKIASEVQKNIDENQKEYFLREKMKVIQNELGHKANKEKEIEELREKIKEAKMPKETEEKVLEELKRYEMMSSATGESGIIRTYLDWMVALPWSKKTKEKVDIAKAETKLDEDHYGLEKVKERIIEYLAVKQMTKQNPQTILCLVGPPGVGKTSLTRSIAESLNREFVKLSFGGVRDEAEIRGHRKTYLGAMPGRIIQSMKKAKVTNPVFLMDEIDKLSSDYKGDPASALLEVLDPEQNKFFSDHYIEEPYDLSNVLFIATANYLGNIPEPLRDRMEIVELSSYTMYEKLEIAKRHIVSKQIKAHGLSDKQLVIEEGALKKIIESYTREAGVRSLERRIAAICRKVTKNILTNEYKEITITADLLEKYLGKEKFTNDQVGEEDEIGVVNGLAYTQYGGDTLPVEVTYFAGKGSLSVTGNLGDVMKESAHAAMSFVKANAEKYGIDDSVFKDTDIHIHVPEGAVPKDGPSAGITMTIALISALSKRKVRHDVGMTGEVTLRGKILPIGGLKEKSIAAHRFGIKKVIIPKQNQKDLEDVPREVRNDIEYVLVNAVQEAIEHVLV